MQTAVKVALGLGVVVVALKVVADRTPANLPPPPPDANPLQRAGNAFLAFNKGLLTGSVQGGLLGAGLGTTVGGGVGAAFAGVGAAPGAAAGLVGGAWLGANVVGIGMGAKDALDSFFSGH